jgi:hypothetical protein
VNDVQVVLTPIVVLSAVIAWISAVTLIWLARQRPRIGFLVERAAAAVILAVATTIYALIARNTDSGYEWFDSDTSKVFVRLVFISLGCIPAIWLVLYWRRGERKP